MKASLSGSLAVDTRLKFFSTKMMQFVLKEKRRTERRRTKRTKRRREDLKTVEMAAMMEMILSETLQRPERP